MGLQMPNHRKAPRMFAFYIGCPTLKL